LKKTLILGIGNDILTDDGIGIRLIEDLRTMNYPKDITFLTITLGGLETLEIIKDYQKVIFLDAIMTENGIPGSVYCYSVNDFKETLHLSNLHDINFLTALELGKKLGIPIPDDIKIIAVEVIEDRVFGKELTPLLQQKYPEILGTVKQIIGKEF